MSFNKIVLFSPMLIDSGSTSKKKKKEKIPPGDLQLTIFF